MHTRTKYICCVVALLGLLFPGAQAKGDTTNQINHGELVNDLDAQGHNIINVSNLVTALINGVPVASLVTGVSSMNDLTGNVALSYVVVPTNTLTADTFTTNGQSLVITHYFDTNLSGGGLTNLTISNIEGTNDNLSGSTTGATLALTLTANTNTTTPAQLAGQGASITNWINATFSTLTGLSGQGTSVTNWANSTFSTLAELAAQGTTITNVFATQTALGNQGTSVTNWANAKFALITNNGAALTNLNASALATGTVPTGVLGSGTANVGTALLGNSSWGAMTNLLAGNGLSINSGTISVSAALQRLNTNDGGGLTNLTGANIVGTLSNNTTGSAASATGNAATSSGPNSTMTSSGSMSFAFWAGTNWGYSISQEPTFNPSTGSGTFQGSLTASSFVGAGTGLTGTASSLSIGGSAGTATTATWVTGGGSNDVFTSPELISPTNSSGYPVLFSASIAPNNFANGTNANASQLFGSGTVPSVNLGSGTATAGTTLLGNQTWSVMTNLVAGNGLSISSGTIAVSAALERLNTNDAAALTNLQSIQLIGPVPYNLLASLLSGTNAWTGTNTFGTNLIINGLLIQSGGQIYPLAPGANVTFTTNGSAPNQTVSIAASVAGGAGFAFNTSQFGGAGGNTNLISGVTLTNVALNGMSNNPAAGITNGGVIGFVGFGGNLTNSSGNAFVDSTITNAVNTRLVNAGTSITNWANATFTTLTELAGQGTTITNVFSTLAELAAQGTTATNVFQWGNASLSNFAANITVNAAGQLTNSPWIAFTNTFSSQGFTSNGFVYKDTNSGVISITNGSVAVSGYFFGNGANLTGFGTPGSAASNAILQIILSNTVPTNALMESSSLGTNTATAGWSLFTDGTSNYWTNYYVGTFTGLGASLTNLNATNFIYPAKWITNNYNVTASDCILWAWGTNEFITNSLTATGKLLTIIVKNPNGSAIITNNGTIFTVPGIGTETNALYLGAWTSPSNSWTGIYDGANW